MPTVAFAGNLARRQQPSVKRLAVYRTHSTSPRGQSEAEPQLMRTRKARFTSEPPCGGAVVCVKQGDAKYAHVAAASILAKQARDAHVAGAGYCGPPSCDKGGKGHQCNPGTPTLGARDVNRVFRAAGVGARGRGSQGRIV